MDLGLCWAVSEIGLCGMGLNSAFSNAEVVLFLTRGFFPGPTLSDIARFRGASDLIGGWG